MFNRFLVAFSALLFFGCGSKGDKMASISLKMDNSSTTLLNDALSLDETSFVTAEYLKLKITAVELVKDDGKYVAVWVNPDCTPLEWKVDNGGKSSIGKEQTSTYYNAENCSLSEVSTYIDIAKSTKDVNDELNSQSWPVPPGTYTSVSLRMCQQNDTDADKKDSLIFKTSEMPEEHGTINLSCGVTNAPVASIAIGEGQVASIKLEYNSSELMTKGTLTNPVAEEDQSAGCSYLDTAMFCHKFGAETFVPSLVVE